MKWLPFTPTSPRISGADQLEPRTRPHIRVLVIRWRRARSFQESRAVAFLLSRLLHLSCRGLLQKGECGRNLMAAGVVVAGVSWTRRADIRAWTPYRNCHGYSNCLIAQKDAKY